MSTGQTRTYPFLQKEKTAKCLPNSLFYCSSAFSLCYHFPTTQPLFSLENAIHFTAAYASDCLMLSSNLSYKYFSNDSLQRHLKDTLRKAWWWHGLELFTAAVRWMAYYDAQGFVLIVSSCISRNRVCYERNRSLPWAQGRRGHILFGKRKRPPDVCLFSSLYCSSAFSLWYQLPTAHPWFFPLCYTLWDFVVAFLTAKLLSVIDDFPLCKVREAWWIRKYRRLFREQVYEWTSCRNSLPFHQLTSLIPGTKKSL